MAVYTRISSENKQDGHYRVSICFILLLMSSLHVSALMWVILRRTYSDKMTQLRNLTQSIHVRLRMTQIRVEICSEDINSKIKHMLTR
jgi:hypothetical protein